MPSARSRFSHRHLLALSTFLVPLAVLAVLGWSELQRSGASAQAALAGEAREFVKRARQAVDQRINQAVRRAFAEEVVTTVQDHGPIRATLQLQRQPDHAALRSIVMLNAQDGVVWPALPEYDPSVPWLWLQPRPGSVLANADLLLRHGQTAAAIDVLTSYLGALAAAYPPGQQRNQSVLELETTARIWLGAACKKRGDAAAARREYEEVVRQLANVRRSLPLRQNRLVAESELVLTAAPADRLGFLRALAGNEHSAHPDGLLSAVFDRVAATFPADDPLRADVERLYDEDVCRTAIRKFASEYEGGLNRLVMLRRRNHGDAGEDDEQRIVWPIGGTTSLVAIRLASEVLSATYHCTSMAVHLDLDALLAPVWQQFASDGSTFVLGVVDPDDNAIVPPPAADSADAAMASETTHELTLVAYPADPARLAAEAEASATKRALLIVVLFTAALGGALWSWRSVSREAELAAMKVDLVSRVSHELKTPLALVRMYGETLGLGRARDSSQVEEFGSIIVREAERLTALIQRILDFSKQQAGTLSYTPAPIDLTTLLRSVVETYSPHLESRGVVLIDSLPHGVHVVCDANACESAIVNLLENAAKYGPDGEEEHEVELVLSTTADRAVVEVRDRGRGIPAAERDRVFDGFYRASNAGEVRGAGLGLSLVRHFARAHGGDIQALPRDGGGTVMRLSLPLAAQPATTATTNQPAGKHPAVDA